jgi:hypothetical protein
MLRAIGHHMRAVAAANALVAAVCWAALAVAAARRMHTRAGAATAFVGVLLLSAAFQVSVWHGLVLAESLSLSLTAALVALVLEVPARWSWPGVAALAVVGTLFVLVRDLNAFLTLALAAAVIGGVALRRVPVRALVAAGTLALASIAGMASSSTGDRWLQGVHHTVRDRVLASASATDWFVSRGMPDADLVRSPAGDDYARLESFWNDPRLAAYLGWLRHHGRRTLATYAVAHPSFLVDGPYASPWKTVGPTPTVRVYGVFSKADPPLGSALNRFVWPEAGGIVFALTALGVVLGAAAVVDPTQRPVALFGYACVGLGLGLAVVAANLDTAETPRHVIGPIALARLGVLFLAVAGVEALVARAVSGRGSSRSTGSASGPADPGTSTQLPSTRTAPPLPSSSAGS